MHITTVDISITTLDSAGAAASAPLLYGVIRNSRGEIVQVLTLDDVTETARGVYEISSFDISDSTKYPGTEFTIFWCTKSSDVSPQTALQRYAIYADHPSGVTTRLITWMPTYRKSLLYGYRIARKLASETEFTTLGYSVYPYFFDRTSYSAPAEFHAASFLINELIWSSTDEAEPILGNECGQVNFIETRHDYCEVYGEIYDVIGGSVADNITFYVHEDDAPHRYSDTSLLARRNGYVAPVNYRGEFSAPLLRGALVTAEIADAGINARFVVPDQPHALLKDLTLYPFDTHRAQ